MGSQKYSSKIKSTAIKLRQSGKSYGYIMKTLNIHSKGTINYWLKDVILTKESKKLLRENSELAYKRGLYKANEQRQEKTKLENLEYLSFGEDKINNVDIHSLAILGAALYWGEGTKSESKNTSYRMISFANSDPLMVSVFMKFLRKVLIVPEDKLHGGIHIYPSTDKEKAMYFWSKITKIHKDKFYIVKQVSRASKNKRPTNLLPFGTAVIRISGRKYFYIIKGMINKITKVIEE